MTSTPLDHNISNMKISYKFGDLVYVLNDDDTDEYGIILNKDNSKQDVYYYISSYGKIDSAIWYWFKKI